MNLQNLSETMVLLTQLVPLTFIVSVINTIGSTDIYRHLNYKVFVSDGGYNQVIVKLDENDNLLWSVTFIYPETKYNHNITKEEFIAEYKTTKHKTRQKAKEMYDEYAQLVSIKSEYIEIETFLNSEYEQLPPDALGELWPQQEQM